MGASEYMTRQGFDALTGKELILLLFPCHHSLFSFLTLSLILDKLPTRWIFAPLLVCFTVSLFISSPCFLTLFLSVVSSSHFLFLTFFFFLFPSLVFFSCRLLPLTVLCSDNFSRTKPDIQLGEGVNRKEKKGKYLHAYVNR